MKLFRTYADDDRNRLLVGCKARVTRSRIGTPTTVAELPGADSPTYFEVRSIVKGIRVTRVSLRISV